MLKGIQVSEDTLEMYKKKLRFQHIGYMILKFVDKGKALELVEAGEKGADFDKMTEKLTDKEAVLILFDFNFEYDQRKISKTILVNWIPSQCKIHDKMIVSTSKEAIKDMFDGIQVDLTYDSRSDCTFENVKNEILKKIAK